MKFRLKQHPIINNLEKHFADKSRDLKFYDFQHIGRTKKFTARYRKLAI